MNRFKRWANLSKMANYIVVVLFSLVFSFFSVSSTVLGGWSPKSTTDNSVRRLAGEAMNKLSENGDDIELFKVCEAQSQVVAGVKYRISIVTKNKNSNDDSANQLCKFEAYERPWENFLEINILSCDKNQKTCP